jgi:hypothetical protein
MARSTVWKDFERWLAKCFGSVRNIGSGRINSNDEGEPRAGDVVMPPELSTLIEAKTRKKFPKSGIYYRVIDTMEEAKDENLDNWFHFERLNGSKKVIIMATSQEWTEFIIKAIRNELNTKYKYKGE